MSLLRYGGLCLLLLATTARALLAVDIASLRPEGYVNDFAHVIDGASRAQLERYATRLDQAGGVQLAIVTLPSLDGEPIEEFANRLYRAWGVGQKGKDEGALLLLVVNDRRSRLEIGRGLEPIITDGRSGGILREMRPLLREGNFNDAVLLAAQRIGQRVAEVKQIDLGQGQPRTRRPVPDSRQSIPWPVLLGGLFLLFWILGGAGRRGPPGSFRRGGGAGDLLTGMILGNMMGRGMPWGGGHYGGGGFGGYDSGDSFGGFGGGDSGGGGASSDW